MALTPGEVAAILGTAGTIALGVWGAIGKGRESAQTLAERLRAEQQARITELEKQKAEADVRADSAEEKASGLQRRLDTCLDFLRDVVGDSYALEWIRKRAAELLRRMEP